MDKKLYQQDEFRELLTERYTCYRTTVIEELRSLIPEQAAYLAKAEDANYKLWKKNLALALQTCKLGLTEDLNGWMKFGLSKIDLKEKSL